MTWPTIVIMQSGWGRSGHWICRCSRRSVQHAVENLVDDPGADGNQDHVIAHAPPLVTLIPRQAAQCPVVQALAFVAPWQRPAAFQAVARWRWRATAEMFAVIM